jgi:hypothetical protein
MGPQLGCVSIVHALILFLVSCILLRISLSYLIQRGDVSIITHNLGLVFIVICFLKFLMALRALHVFIRGNSRLRSHF